MDDVKVKAGLRCLSDLYMYCIGNSQERLNGPTNVQRSTTKSICACFCTEFFYGLMYCQEHS